MNLENIKEKLEASLSPKRFNHSINVMNTAVLLAKRFGEDEDKARIAGLLHDCARDIRGPRMYDMCKAYNIELDYLRAAQPELIHGELGVYVVKEQYNIQDKQVLSAILWHTTGCEKMTSLDKIIFLADYIEPARSFNGVEEARRLAYEDLNRAMLYALDRTIKYVMMREVFIHPDTLKARNSILREIKNL